MPYENRSRKNVYSSPSSVIYSSLGTSKPAVQPLQRVSVKRQNEGEARDLKPFQLKPNNTGLPDNLKSGVENLSGFSMDDVKVHYNSSQPAQLNALAYAQGTNIHIAPGQERHLPHEAWHVAQQKQGRVQATMQMKGTAINDDAGLETEADVMGAKALQYGDRNDQQPMLKNSPVQNASVQRFKFEISNAILDTTTYTVGAFPLSEPGMIKALEEILYLGFDPLDKQQKDLSAADKKEIRRFISVLKDNAPSRREAFGYRNPTHNSTVGLELLEEGAQTPYDPSRWNDKEEWLLSPSRHYQTYSPTSRKPDKVFSQGHSTVVFGHDEGASEHFNRVGHSQTPDQNRQWNQRKDTFHGLERRDKSNKSGSLAPEYEKPSKKKGSNPMYYDPKDSKYDPKYGKLF